MRRRLAFVMLGLAGCFTTDLDPSRSGAFACEPGDDDECPADMICINALCEREDAAPIVEILSPGDLERLPLDIATDVPIELRVRNLDMMPLGDHVFGEGHIKVFADANPRSITFTATGPDTMRGTVEFAPSAGARRLVVQAERNDGRPYDNPGATARILFWLDDGEPYVAIKRPWPNTEIDSDLTDVTVEIATINFELADPGMARVKGRGHAHLFYNDPSFACAFDITCPDYTVITSDGVTPVRLTKAPPGPATLTAFMRHVNHEWYCHPLDESLEPEDPVPPCPDVSDTATFKPIFDTIEIVRVDD